MPPNLQSSARLAMLRSAGRVMRKPPLPAAPQSILLIRPDHFGDLVLAAPALPLLRQAFPTSRITAWVGPWGEPAWQASPDLDALGTGPFPGFTRTGKPNLFVPYGQAFKSAGELRGRFDLAINLRFDFWWGALAANLAGIPVAGYDVAECLPFLSLPVPYQPGLHETDQNLRLVRLVAQELGTVPTDSSSELPANGIFPEVDLPLSLPRGAIAFHPGAGAEVKLWQEEHWASLADEFAIQMPVVFTVGSPEEMELVLRIRGQMVRPAAVVSGLTLQQLATYYGGCQLVIGPDNGPLHVARAVGTPTVTLFGPTDPAQFGPYSPSPLHEVVRLPWRCIPCRRLDYNPAELTYHLCVRLIGPDEVLEAARRVLRARVSRSS